MTERVVVTDRRWGTLALLLLAAAVVLFIAAALVAWDTFNGDFNVLLGFGLACLAGSRLAASL